MDSNIRRKIVLYEDAEWKICDIKKINKINEFRLYD